MIQSLKRSLAGLLLLAGILVCLEAAAEKDYLLAVTRPNQLYLVDVKARKVERVYDIPGEGIPNIISVADDGKVAYVLTNRWESIAGIDLDTGEQVFRADMSSDDVRVKCVFAMNVSRDGKELYVHQSPVRLKLDEYEVMDTQIAVYDTADGLNAKPKRVFPAPRRIVQILPAMERGRIFAFGWDLYAFNTESGEIEKTYPVFSWARPNFAEPDVFAVFYLYEQANIFSTPYYAMRTDKSPDDPTAYLTGLLTFNLETEEFEMQDFENTEVIIFSSVVNPVRPNEVYMVYNTLTKLDREKGEVVKRVDVEHSYYSVNVSSDGKEIYLGGTMDDIAVYDSQTLEKLANIQLPGGADQSAAGSIRIVRR